MLQRLEADKPVRRSLQPWGNIHIDRQLPFVCVYRRPQDRNDPGTDRLVVSEAAYINVCDGGAHYRWLVIFLERLSAFMIERFGAFLIFELWASSPEEKADPGLPPRPEFRIHEHIDGRMPSTVQTLQADLAAVAALKRKSLVSVHSGSSIRPPGMRPLFSIRRLRETRVSLLGLEVKPIYINPENHELFPLLHRGLRRQLTHVLDKMFYEFAHECTTHEPPHYHSLGRRAVTNAVWEIDERLAAVSNSFDFLIQSTPVNAERAWRRFQRDRFEKIPVFRYRPRVIDPGLEKRRLFAIRIDRVEDPTLMHLFLEKQMELDCQLSMLHDLGTKKFFYGSLLLHGEVQPGLLNTARRILERIPSRAGTRSAGGSLTAEQFAARARTEMQRYASRYSGFSGTVEVTDSIPGLMVSRGRLLVGRGSKIPIHRVEALIQHEVGTHLLTYFNGKAQPFKMLYSGLPGYDEMQEGLAVLSEYLVGGLTPARLRVLAARVEAAHALMDGASFLDVYRSLNREHGFAQKMAFTIAMRVFRGGGLLKDAVYLRGLTGLLDYLAKGRDFEILFVGKIAARHVGVIKELTLREILKAPPLYPQYADADADAVRKRVKKLRSGISALELLQH